MLRSRQRRGELPAVADAGTATVLDELLLVDCKDDVVLQPDEGGHFASSRRTLRRFFMTLRAASICCSKAGS